MTESWWVLLNQFLTRVWPVPPALGIDQRIVNGYLYVSPTSITDPARDRGARAESSWSGPATTTRTGTRSTSNWIAKAEDCIKRLRAIEFEPLPDLEPIETVTSRRGRRRPPGT